MPAVVLFLVLAFGLILKGLFSQQSKVIVLFGMVIVAQVEST